MLRHGPGALPPKPPDNVQAAGRRGGAILQGFGRQTQCRRACSACEDVNGDGGEDWIADYAKLNCEGGINQMCDDDGCTLQIYLWDGATAWNLAFEETVQSYRFGKRDGKPVAGGDGRAACDKPEQQDLQLDLSPRRERHRARAASALKRTSPAWRETPAPPPSRLARARRCGAGSGRSDRPPLDAAARNRARADFRAR